MATKKDRKRNYYGNGNREYKSDVISMMLQIPEYALNVYNAMNNSAYTDPDLVEIILLENGISLSIRNDASFCISNYLNLYEHQSSYSPNAPLRFLIYLTGLLRKMIEKRDLYGRKLVQIETPHFAIFYNGTEKRPEREVLKLSDAFVNKTDQPEIELVCTVYNINQDCNVELLAKSEVLSGYMSFVNKVRENLAEQKTAPLDETEFKAGLETAIEDAIDYCIENHIMETFFRENRNEVTKNMVLDYTWERREELIRAEEYEDGRTEGRQEGIQIGEKRGRTEGRTEALTELIHNLMETQHISEAEARRMLKIQ